MNIRRFVRLVFLCCALIALVPVQAVALKIVYTANTFGVYAPCPS